MQADSVRSLSDAELIDQITALASLLAAETCRFLMLVAELDRREQWAAWGAKSAAHWLSWRCALSPRAAREHVQVARALVHLPVTTEAFSRGELSYSKVRALVRVASPEREAELVELARTATAAQLEAMIRATVAATRDPIKQESLRRLVSTEDDLGMAVIHVRLCPDERVLVDAALDAAVKLLPSDDAEGGAAAPLAARRVDALVRICESYLANGEGCRSGAHRQSLVIHVDAAAGGFENAMLDDGTPVDPATVSRVACDATRFTIVHGELEPLGSGRASYTPSRALRRAIKRRSKGRCEWTGCHDEAYVELHHIEWWEAGGPTEWWNLAALCWHHHRAVHHRGFEIALDRTTGTITCYLPDGTLVTDPATTRAAGQLTAEVEPEAIVPLWRGEAFDLEHCVDAVMSFTGRTTAA